jgi:hypothetical protein
MEFLGVPCKWHANLSHAMMDWPEGDTEGQACRLTVAVLQVISH